MACNDVLDTRGGSSNATAERLMSTNGVNNSGSRKVRAGAITGIRSAKPRTRAENMTYPILNP